MINHESENRMPVIDAHSHLGDILYPNGGALIQAGPVKNRLPFDAISVSEMMGHRLSWLRDHVISRYLRFSIVLAERERNATASLANMDASLTRAGVDQAVCLPIAPHVTFDDLKTASLADPRLIPFTSVDFSLALEEIPARLAGDVAAGARGLKLHSIIQKEPLSSARTLAAVEAVAAHKLPVLVHGGVSSYYLKRESHREEPAYGDIPLVEALIAEFPAVPFIVGHAGLYQTKEVMRRLSGRRNVWVDISFQPVGVVRKLISVFGPERVLFSSDWPFGRRRPMVRIVKQACRGDLALERLIFYENAAHLLNG